MELRQYLIIVKRWAWLLVIGVLIGGLGGYLYTKYQTPTYQTSTKVFIMEAPEDRITSLFAVNDQQLAQNFTELLVTRPVITATSERLGYPVRSGQIRVQQVREAQLIQIIVEDSSPKRAAEIANMLVKVFLEYHEELQASRYASSEESLQAQLQQLEQQISTLQGQLSNVSQISLDTQIEQVTKVISDLQAEIRVLQEEIVRLEYSREAVTIIDQDGRRFSALATPNVDQRIEITAKENRLAELQSLLSKYQEIYVQLSYSNTGSQLRQASNIDPLQSALILYQQIYSNVLSNYESLRLARLKGTPNIVQVDEALPPSTPIRPRPMINISLGLIMGLVLVGGTAFLIEYLDDTIRTPEDVVNVLDLPVLSTITEMQHSPRGDKNPLPVVIEQPRSPISEAFRSLRTNLEFTELDKPLKTLLVTSANAGEGKTTVAVNLAIVTAQAGKRVILLDADLRRPQMHNVLGISNRGGLSDVLRDHASLQSVTQKYRSESLLVITSGGLPPNPAEVLASDRMMRILSDLRDQADVLIIDGPPFILADASVLAAKVDGVLMVVRSKKTQANAALAMLDQLDRLGARVLGIVLNRMQRKESSYYYYSRNLKGYSTYAYDEAAATSPTLEKSKK